MSLPRLYRLPGLGLALVWVMLLTGLLAAPYLLHRPDPGADLTHQTAWLFLIYYGLALVGLLLSGPRSRPISPIFGRVARTCWTLAWAAYLVHVGMAFHHYHYWSHAAAVAHVEQASQFGPGIYFSYLFTLLWTADVAWWWIAPARYARRSRGWGGLLHGFMLFMVFNATVVYGSDPFRWGGILLFAVLGATALGRWKWAPKARLP
jgi:hypothetical protein